MIALVTDSSSQVPLSLCERYGIRVVPVTVVVDGHPYQEGVDLDPEVFLERLRAGAAVSTAAPSPGQVAEVYREVAAAGASQIVSIHAGAGLSAVLAAAGVAARSCEVPVELVDTATVSFAAGCCVWAAAEDLAGGGDAASAAAAARRAAGRLGNVFVVSSLDLPRRGGRLAEGATAARVPVLALEGDRMEVVADVSDAAQAVAAMAGYVKGWAAAGERLRVGVGDTDAGDLADELAEAISALDVVAEMVRYHVGPSVAAHTGPGTVGTVFTPL